MLANSRQCDSRLKNHCCLLKPDGGYPQSDQPESLIFTIHHQRWLHGKSRNPLATAFVRIANILALKNQPSWSSKIFHFFFLRTLISFCVAPKKGTIPHIFSHSIALYLCINSKRVIISALWHPPRGQVHTSKLTFFLYNLTRSLVETHRKTKSRRHRKSWIYKPTKQDTLDGITAREGGGR